MNNCECNDYISISALIARMEKGVSSNEIITVNYQLCGNNQNIVWTSTDDDIVSVSYNKNTNKVTITAKTVGTATVKAYCEEDPNIYDYCTVEVLDKMPVTKVKFDPDEIFIEKGKTVKLNTIVYPLGAGNRTLSWKSDNESIVTVNDKGVVTAKAEGTALITATAKDGSGMSDICIVRVGSCDCDCCDENNFRFINSTIELNVGASYRNPLYCETGEPLSWSSNNPSAATVDSENGMITAKRTGIAKITVRKVNNPSIYAMCEVWVRGNTPVFMLHGRQSNSIGTWGAINGVTAASLSNLNDHYDYCENAEVTDKSKEYINTETQKMVAHPKLKELITDSAEKQFYNDYKVFNGEYGDGYKNVHPEGGNLAYYLAKNGYTPNVDMFVFNYPNQDAVVHSAKKFKCYIENLIKSVREGDNDQLKATFYKSRRDYMLNRYTINIVGHSMGGLVARYYIENLGQDTHVDKLITICTPHWGSGYGDLSSLVGSDIHVLCDHDLDLDSAMFGGNYSTNLNCNAVLSNCYNGSYTLTDELLYNKTRKTRYYAIAGIDYPFGLSSNNDYTFELPTSFTTMQQIVDYFTEKGIYSFNPSAMLTVEIDIEDVGDNMVGFLSQIGWIGDNQNTTPAPRIQMEKIFVDVDTDGGNGGGFFIVEILPDGSNIFHSKVNHRQSVCNKIIEYLEE